MEQENKGVVSRDIRKTLKCDLTETEMAQLGRDLSGIYETVCTA